MASAILSATLRPKGALRGSYINNFTSAPSRGVATKIMYYVVYFLESIKYQNRHYIGFTTNLKQRITDHNQGTTKSTKKYKPWKVIYAELYLNENDARGREKFLKSGSGWKFLKKQIRHYLENKNYEN